MELVKKTLLPLLLVLMVACSWLNPFDSMAIEKVDAGMKRAAITFATARIINAAVSVVQESELDLEPGGVGVKIALGEALDPFNDLVEKFSDLMLLACVSLGIQRVLLSIGSHWLMSAFLSIATVLWAYSYLKATVIPAAVKKLLLIAIVLRFCLPTITLGSDVLFQNFLAKDYSVSQKIIEANAADPSMNAPPITLPENANLWEKMKSFSPQDINISGKISSLLKAAKHSSEHFIQLMVIFMLQTLIMPLALLWGLLALVKSFFGMQLPLSSNRLLSRKPELEPKPANQI